MPDAVWAAPFPAPRAGRKMLGIREIPDHRVGEAAAFHFHLHTPLYTLSRITEDCWPPKAESVATMIQLKTLCNVIDNSGASVAECVKVLKMKRAARIGDRIIVVIQRQRNFSADSNAVTVSAANKVRRGDIRHAVVVRTAKKYQRPDGSVVSFDDNACVLVNKGGEPIGSRMNGVVGKELRGKGWSKILSLAPMHL